MTRQLGSPVGLDWAGGHLGGPSGEKRAGGHANARAGEWLRMIGQKQEVGELPFGYQVAKKLMAVARDPFLKKGSNATFSDDVVMRAKVLAAAGLMVAETGHGPKLRGYKAHPGVAVASRIAPRPSPVPGQPPDRERTGEAL
jgi:hypothetical protein